MEYEIVDPSFGDLILGNCGLERLHTGTRWAEGPCYFGDGQFLVWSDIPNSRLLRYVEGLGVDTFRVPSHCANGNTRDRLGRLITCEHETRRVTRTEYDGTIRALCSSYEGRRLNSPNDVVVANDDAVWFTDPPYGILSDYEGRRSASELDGNYVFRLPSGAAEPSIVAGDFDRPNGLAFTPDQSELFVADSGAPRHIRRFRVEGEQLAGGEVFAESEAGVFDGFRFDTHGHLWTSTAAGVSCYDAKGNLLGRIAVPEKVANLTFGGPKNNRLFITATTSLYAIFVNARGAQSS